MMVLLASIAGAVGAVCRYALSGWAQERARSDFPVGTLTVNVAGAFGLGMLVGVGSDSAAVLAGIAFFGGFTTFSTWMVETIRLGLRSPRALVNLTTSLVIGIAAAVLGFSVTS